MSATQHRPHEPMPAPFDDPDMVWLHHDGRWLGIPKDACDHDIARAIALLEWMSRPIAAG